MASDTPIPAYLDFNDLRTEGITHLGNLTGKIWTDYNAHDPGITILEALCYALLDLDYRTKLPAADIFARNPAATGADNNFYSPAQILACNPLTILDYRKLLSDIEGVRNAWLEVAVDQVDNCLPENRNKPGTSDCTGDYQPLLNGLYHVYLELEDGVDEAKIHDAVAASLRTHRNLCEDIADITMLNKLPLGVCAIVELNTDADPAQVYIDMMSTLGDFLSPSPHFYTLQELLDKGKPIDTIFAGRPYNTSISHGFVDTEELAQIQLKKEIHLSDLYKALFEVTGIKTIRDLQWKPCGSTPRGGWKFNIPQNNVIDFTISCCGIQFLRGGKPVPFDPTQYEVILQMMEKKNLYSSLLPNLDLPFPKGNYRDDLGDYYSIQNDFPNAYGISKGGVPEDAPIARKAHALQLKGFLLFFDQLLADYLTQLAHIRELFSMGGDAGAAATGDCGCGCGPGGGAAGGGSATGGGASGTGPTTGGGATGAGGSTYFLNTLINGDDPDSPNYVPDVDKLWTSYVSGDLATILGTPGSTLVFPVDPKTLKPETLAGQLTDQLPCDLSAPNYDSWDELQDVIIGLKADFEASGSISIHYVPIQGGLYYYISTSSSDIVLVSKKTFTDSTKIAPRKYVTDAQKHAAFVVNNGMLDDSYSLFSITGDRFTFTMDYNDVPLTSILQADLEDASLYTRRRQYFLDHLLARFAERFTDYAMLEYGPTDPLKKAQAQLVVEENYLSHYALLSSQRGQAGDYSVTKWNTDNISGFEKKWKALIGAGNGGRKSLCNFLIQKIDPEYSLSLIIGGKTFFNPEEKYASEEAATLTATQLLKALGDRANYSVNSANKIEVKYAPAYSATLADQYSTETEANTIADRLAALFGQRPSQRDVFPSAYMYKAKLVDYSGRISKLSIQSYASADEATKMANDSLANNQVPDPALWQPASDSSRPTGMLYRNTLKTDAVQFLDLDSFKIDINDTIVDKPDKFAYDVLPVSNAFKFQAVDEFDSREEALTHAKELLLLATVSSNYWVEEDTSGLCTIWITSAGRRQAGYNTKLVATEAGKLAEKIQEQMRRQLYTVQVGNEPSRWKFHFYLGYEDSGRLCFDSTTEYDSSAAAMDALRTVWTQQSALRLQQEPGGLTLRADDGAVPVVVAAPMSAAPAPVAAPATVAPVTAAPTPTATDGAAAPVAEVPAAPASSPATETAPAASTTPASPIPESAAPLLQLHQAIQKAVTSTSPNDYSSVKMDNISQQGQYSWQLVNTDQRVAFCTRDYPDKDSAEQGRDKLAGLLKQGIKYLEICLDGKITRRRKDPQTGVFGYHYMVRSHNYYYSSGKELILFESVKGYPTEDAAKQAFTANYLPLLEQAAQESNYGPLISLTEIISNDPPPNPIVFVPKETKVSLGGADADVIKKLVAIAGSYPIKRMECPGTASTDPCAATTTPKKYVYYCGISIPDPTAGAAPFEWKSTCKFPTIAEALLDFAFFIRLMRAPVNLFTDSFEVSGKPTVYRIYIHEVLAEGATRFATEEETWGTNGLERFICALKDQDSVVCYQQTDCTNTFLVNCGPPVLQHPCTYSTPRQRDAALDQLITAKWNPKAYTAYRDNGLLVLTEGQARPFAKAPITDASKDDIQLVTELIGKINDESNKYIIKDDLAQLTSADGNTLIAESYQAGVGLEDWQHLLAWFMHRYPFVLTSDGRYSVELRLTPPTEDSGCYTSWKSTCLFNTPGAAREALDYGLALLARSDYYLPTFTDDCRCFGISLSDPKDEVAIHPQSYNSREQVIAAVQRMRTAVNTEGLHLVEHILLRHRSGAQEDCTCLSDAYCQSPADCGFAWTLPGIDTDPCAPVTSSCFIPGNDPWSFIATVVLPAWPEKFSRQDNKIVLENALYREAPAHVMLRVLWLTPRDCCRFEANYKSWLKGAGGCDFIQFLFKTNFELSVDCQPCHPCPQPLAAPDPCSDNLKSSRAKQLPVFSGQVSQLYCWTGATRTADNAAVNDSAPANSSAPTTNTATVTSDVAAADNAAETNSAPTTTTPT